MLSDCCIVLDNSTHTIEIRHGRLLTASHGVVSRSDRYSDVDVVNGAIFPHPQSYTSDVTCYVITNDVTNGGLPSADNRQRCSKVRDGISTLRRPECCIGK